MRSTTLYRFFDAETPLYVGVSLSIWQRWRDHRENQPWFGMVTRATLEHFATRQEALVAELKAIRDENPRHNIVGRVDRQYPQTAPKRPIVEEPLEGQFFILGAPKPVPVPLEPESLDQDWSSLPMSDVALLIKIDKETR